MEQGDGRLLAPRVDGLKLTIGIPVYNGGHLIEKALSGLADQTYRKFVLTISDNASTDNTWDILQEWAEKDARINIRRQAENIGAMANFRFVLDQADTEYFMWHAHDDFVPATYVERLCAILDQDTDCMNAVARTDRVNTDGSINSVDNFPGLSSKFRFARVNSIIKIASPSWVYGVFRTDYLRHAYGSAEKLGYVWGWDRIALLPAMLNDQVRGSNEVYLRCLVTDLSENLLRPVDLNSRMDFSNKYMAANFQAFFDSRLSFFEKIFVFPYFYYHAVTNRGFGKSLLKILRRWIVYNFRSQLGKMK